MAGFVIVAVVVIKVGDSSQKLGIESRVVTWDLGLACDLLQLT